MKKAFDLIDTDNDGYIDISDLKSAFQEPCNQILTTDSSSEEKEQDNEKDEKWVELIKPFDKDMDGKVSFKDLTDEIQEFPKPEYEESDEE